MEHTHFGYQTVPTAEKAARVGAVFDSVADDYDVMNDLMSLGIHRLWKRAVIELAAPHPGERVLDLAGGTGDLAVKLAQRVGAHGYVVLADINAAMLNRGRDRLLNAGASGNLAYLQADAECLPFSDHSFDCITLAFGLRNVTHKERALAAMQRILRAGGRALILEFSKPILPGLQPLYDWYSFNVLPRLGHWVANDAASYRYLAESIRMHPDQEALRGLMEGAGFERCAFYNLSGGIVAIHRGVKL